MFPDPFGELEFLRSTLDTTPSGVGITRHGRTDTKQSDVSNKFVEMAGYLRHTIWTTTISAGMVPAINQKLNQFQMIYIAKRKKKYIRCAATTGTIIAANEGSRQSLCLEIVSVKNVERRRGHTLHK